MNIQIKARSMSIVCGLVAAIALSSCSKKPDETATAPSPAMSSSPTASASSTPATPPAASPSATSSTPQAAPTLSATASTLGVKPTDETTCPANAPVKGKVTKKRGNIYHVAKGPDYAKVKPEICFKDTATAEKAGFHAPKQ